MPRLAERKNKMHWVETKTIPGDRWYSRDSSTEVIACGGKPKEVYNLPSFMITCEPCALAFSRRGK